MLTKYRRADHGMTTSHFMCGLGGETLGFALAGFDPYFNTNHNQQVIDTIVKNFPNTRTKVADVSNLDFRNLPRTVGLFGSPICKEASPAGGRKKRKRPELRQDGLFEEPSDDEAWVRTRTTAYCILRATEICDYDFVACENVIEFATDWPLFMWWIGAMEILGYNATVTCVSSAHVGDEQVPHAPQWRDRMYVVFTRQGIRLPDLAPRPLARCVCGDDVEAVQWWKGGGLRPDTPFMIGKYRDQYLYRSTHEGACNRAIIEPYVRVAAEVIDFTNVGQQVGDPKRRRPIVENTRVRIARGLADFYDRDEWAGDYLAPPMLVPSGGTYAERPTSVYGEPFRTQIANPKGFETLVLPPPFIAELRNNCTFSPVTEPLSTIAAGGNHHALVMPYYSTGVAKSVLAPFDTFTTRDRHAIVRPAVTVDDCFIRMVQPEEQLGAQAFPTWYKVVGNKGERTAQAGNAVSVNVAKWLGDRIFDVLDSRSAA